MKTEHPFSQNKQSVVTTTKKDAPRNSVRGAPAGRATGPREWPAPLRDAVSSRVGGYRRRG